LAECIGVARPSDVNEFRLSMVGESDCRLSHWQSVSRRSYPGGAADVSGLHVGSR
jgi:hypothetical protein